MLLEKKQQKLQDNARFVNNYSRTSSYVQGNVNYNYAPTENFQVENEVRQTANQFANANTSYVQQPTYNYQQEQNGYRMQQNMPQNNYYQDNYMTASYNPSYNELRHTCLYCVGGYCSDRFDSRKVESGFLIARKSLAA